ncbi:MAG: hypothetical protein IPL40_07655 [Proteobacteria bacterium]|nr:hypothetical protein [Pseudomonadota bacterium]
MSSGHQDSPMPPRRHPRKAPRLARISTMLSPALLMMLAAPARTEVATAGFGDQAHSAGGGGRSAISSFINIISHRGRAYALTDAGRPGQPAEALRLALLPSDSAGLRRGGAGAGRPSSPLLTEPLVRDRRHHLVLHELHGPKEALERLTEIVALPVAPRPAAEGVRGSLLGAHRASPGVGAFDLHGPASSGVESDWYSSPVALELPAAAASAGLGLAAPVVDGAGETLLGVMADYSARLVAAEPSPLVVGTATVTPLCLPMLDHMLEQARAQREHRIGSIAGLNGIAEVELPEPGFVVDGALRVSRIHTVGPERLAGLTLGDRITHLNDRPMATPADLLEAYLEAGETPLAARVWNELLGETRSVTFKPSSGDALDRARLDAIGLAVASFDGGAFVTDVFPAQGLPALPLRPTDLVLGGVLQVPIVRRVSGAGGRLTLTQTFPVPVVTRLSTRQELLRWLVEAATRPFPAALVVAYPDGAVRRVPRQEWQAHAEVLRGNIAGGWSQPSP